MIVMVLKIPEEAGNDDENVGSDAGYVDAATNVLADHDEE